MSSSVSTIFPTCSKIFTRIKMDFEWKQRITFMFVVAVQISQVYSVVARRSASENHLNSHQHQFQRYQHGFVNNFAHLNAIENDLPVQPRLNVQQLPKCGPISAEMEEVPKSFDARYNRTWINCMPGFWEIRNKGSCSSWAFAVSSVLTDRYCIKTKGVTKFRVSEQNLFNCVVDKQADVEEGVCEGANVEEVWSYLMKKGVVSGGHHGSEYGCQASKIPPCRNFSDPSSDSACSKKPHRSSFQCQDGCENPTYVRKYEEDILRVDNACVIDSNADNWVTLIQAEIYRNGPVLAIMNLYEDIHDYKKGDIYDPITEDDTMPNRIAVKIVGWGEREEDGKKYWIVANNWGYLWGDGGFFYVSRDDARVSTGAYITRFVTVPTPHVEVMMDVELNFDEQNETNDGGDALSFSKRLLQYLPSVLYNTLPRFAFI